MEVAIALPVLPSDISGIFSAFSALIETLPKEKK